MLGTRFDAMARGRRSLALDLKHPDAKEVVLKLVEQADVLLEGFRPGVTQPAPAPRFSRTAPRVGASPPR